MRTFIAVEVPAVHHGALLDLQKRLGEARADVRWVRPEGFHVTFKFLGDSTTEERQGVAEALRLAAAEIAPVTFDLGRLGSFPERRAPRVVWIGPTVGAAELVEAQRIVETCVAAAGFPPEGRRFHPHVTLGRVRSPVRAQALIEQLESAAVEPLGPFTVPDIVLFESQLKPEGAHYVPLERVPLEGRRT